MNMHEQGSCIATAQAALAKACLPLSLFVLVFLAGCHANPIENCGQPGTVEMLDVESVGGIGVYLPPCYDPQAKSLYPVLYLLPGAGGAPEDWFGTGVASVADEMILTGEVRPFLIVTTDDTLEDLDAERIVDTLIPYIESRYRANPKRTWRAIAGGSLGGASAYLLTFQHPDVFPSAGVFGNGLVTGQEEQLEAWLQAIPAKWKPRLFLNTGTQDAYMYQQALALIPILDRHGIRHTEIFTPGGHAGNYWLSNFPAYFKWLEEDWK